VAEVTAENERGARPLHPGAVRVSLAPSSAHAELPPVVVEPAGTGVASLVDGRPADLELLVYGRRRATAATPDGTRREILFGEVLAADRPGVRRREVVVDGWRFELEIESELHARLRDRGRRAANDAGHGGPTDVRAMIPGVVVSVSVAEGDEVEAGQPLLVVEAMKMQNEVRAPRMGRVDRVAVGAGKTIELGELLLVLA
jgi:biotin carboxyl carrier protein